MLKNKKNIFRFWLLFLLIGASLFSVHLAAAQVNVGLNAVNDSIALGNSDPRTIAARVINITLLVLGVIAVGLIIYGGFIWMSSNGDEEKIEKAKKILKNGIIGLVIILSAWGIASFILSRLLGATGNSNGTGCSNGQTAACGCDGFMSCIDGSWGPCLHSDCSHHNGPTSCDGNTILGGCQAVSQICAKTDRCDDTTCTCVPKGQAGDSCDQDTSTPECEADKDFCGEYLSCNPDSCLCYGPPVITAISPAGGFCKKIINASCTVNAECPAGGCNTSTPNGAVDNLITITGTNFGVYDPAKSKVIFGGEVAGKMPTELNPDCIDSWTNKQIIIAVPAGAVTGPLKVVTADNQTDATNDEVGPKLDDFVVNKIVRPGLCLINPNTGLLSQQVVYRGVNLYHTNNSKAYFGSYDTNVLGLDSVFTDPASLIATTTIPNLEQGEMSSFVKVSINGKEQKSNYVDFIKQAEANAGPFISYFTPTSGRAGQYVTIHGGGFGGARGTSQVFFGKVEADYTFPEVCASSVWRDKQIIVKVPSGLADGNYQFHIKLGEKMIDSQNANPNVFVATASSSLKTSICKISPQRGQIGTPVSLWGEYFGNNNSLASVVFTNNKAVSTQIRTDQTAQLVNPNVPEGAITGAVKVVKNSEWGNDVNFEIGTCTNDADCGGETCCPAGTYKEGRCAAALADCYINIPNSVFEWSFSTGYGSTTPPTTYDSCQGMAKALGACQINSFCPNSPGLCSPFAATSTIVGTCDSTCNSVVGCPSSAKDCVYNSEHDVCVRTDYNCALDAPFTYTLGNKTFNTIKTCKTFPQFGDRSHWQIEVSTSCPTDWTRLAGNVCIDSTNNQVSSCALCRDGQSCKTIDDSGFGRCVTAKLCADSAHCSGTQCIGQEAGRCDCCCTIGQDARDCCAPLTCTGTCGSDTTNDNSGFGECSGCAIKKADGTFDAAASDQACNCTNHSGKYCDTSVPTGVCVDCSRLSTKESCQAHSAQCCFDSRGTTDTADDVCRGGNGQEITKNTEDSRFGYCAYFDCQDASSTPPGNPSLCASTTPKIFGAFNSIPVCETICPKDPGHSICSSYNGNLAGCAAAAGCCFDFSSQKCHAGAQIPGGSDKGSGYCAYYNCQAKINGERQCDPTPTTTGAYRDLETCTTQCPLPDLGGLGKDCRNLNTNSTTDCNQSFCSTPFACLNATGTPGLPGDCGACCCKVSDPNSCSGIGIGTLTCQKNQAPCSGNDRGLCCGCSQDTDCGNANTLGCDSGACCRTRPAVITDQISPAHGAAGVCRNSLLRIPFDQAMDTDSLMNNIILLEEHDYGLGVCPNGTFLAAANGFVPVHTNWLARTYIRAVASVKLAFRHLGLSSSSALADLPSPSKLYCVVPATISVSQDGNGSIAEVAPKKLLAAATEYYLVVKGDENLDSNAGVMSQWQLGMNGEGYLNLSSHLYTEGQNISFNNLIFKNSYISSFTTLPQQGNNAGICAVDYVAAKPASYLFQSTDNDLNENDDDPQNSSFDTKKDRDKVFTANAYSANGQLLHPTTGYNWDWNWSVIKPSVVNLEPVAGLAENKVLAVAGSGVSDDATVISAQINMDRFSTSQGCDASAGCTCLEPDCFNKCCNVYQDGDGTKVNIPAFVFLCQNPWPAIDPATLSWSPWYDTCPTGTANCSNYNYKFYYCRDAGAAGLADDLPAMINPGVIKGRGDSLVCSEGQAPCSSPGARCGDDNNYDGEGDGFCIWNVLKESYFFKEATPTVGAITAAVDEADGRTVRLEWYGSASLIYNAKANQMGKYRIYYAPASSGTMSFVDVKPTDAYSTGGVATVCTPLIPNSGENYSCRFRLSNLNVGQTYRFKISAITAAQVESALSDEKTVKVTDTVAPAIPQGLHGEIINNQRLHFTWQANAGDTLFYRLYHGTASNQYGESFDSDNQATSLDLDLRQFAAGTHYFALSALDTSNNESGKSAQTSLAIVFNSQNQN